MSLESLIFFFVSTSMISMMPGPNMLLAFQHGINYGVKKTLWTLAGLSCGLFLLLLSALLGIDMLTRQFPWALMVIKVVGAIYLAYLGIQSWRKAGESSEIIANNKADLQVGESSLVDNSRKHVNGNSWQLFKMGIWVSLSNPKAILFFAAFFPKFIDFNKPLLIQYVILTIGFFINETTWQIVYTLGGKKLANWLQNGQRLIWLNRSCGVLFVLIAVGLMWEVISN